MRRRSLEMLPALLTATVAACAHAPAPVDRASGGKAVAEERVLITGSRIPQRLDSASPGLRSISPVVIYSREQIDVTGRQANLSEALRTLDPSVSP